MIAEGILLPYQSRWIADEAQIKVCEKSRQIGMSWATALEAVLFAIGPRKRGDVAYTGYNARMASGFVDDCALWARSLNLAFGKQQMIIDEAKGLMRYSLYFRNGHKIVALSSRPENFRSRGGLGIIDEAAFHGDFPGLLKAVTPFLIWGGRVSILSTHNGVDNAFNALINDIRAKRFAYSLHRTTFDEAIAQGLYHRICEQRGIDWSAQGERQWRDEIVDLAGSNADEELHCIPSRSGGQYIDPGLLERACSDGVVVRYEAPADFALRPDAEREAAITQWCERELVPVIERAPKRGACALGEDFGRVADLTVLAPMLADHKAHYRVPFVVELRNVPYQQQLQVIQYLVPRMRVGRIACDATGNGGYIAERAQQLYGASVADAVTISRTWYADACPPLRAAFEDDLIKFPRDAGLVSDLAALRVVAGQPSLPSTNTAIKGKERSKARRHGDFAIALTLAYAAARALVFGTGRVTHPKVDKRLGNSRRATSGLTRHGGIW